MCNMRGTQTVVRAVSLLREVAARGSFGWRLTDLAAHCGLDKATAYRMLKCLEEERLVKRRAADRHYLPGPLLFELGLTLAPHAAFQSAAQAPLLRLARRTGGVAFLYLRSNNDFVCAGRVGKTELKGLSIHIGTRRPLVTSAGGMAIVVALPAEESKAVVAENMKRLSRFGELRARSIERMLRRSQSQGFGINLGDVVPGINAFGFAIRNSQGSPVASLGLSASDEDFPPGGTARLRELLDEEAAALARHLPTD
jgi:DNA-binding IclR family transcriptional regulator